MSRYGQIYFEDCSHKPNTSHNVATYLEFKILSRWNFCTYISELETFFEKMKNSQNYNNPFPS